MTFQQPNKADLLIAIIAIGAGIGAICEGHLIFGLSILAL